MNMYVSPSFTQTMTSLAFCRPFDHSHCYKKSVRYSSMMIDGVESVVQKVHIKLEGTHRAWTHAVLLLTLTITWPLNPKTIGLPLVVRYSKVISCTKFEHWVHSILSYVADNSVKNALSLIDPVTLTFDLSTPKPYHF